MKRNIAETILGAVVIFVAVAFLVFSYRIADLRAIDGYELTADFAGTGGLKAGDDVLVSGVKVGHVEKVTLVPENYLARVHIAVDPGIQLPEDTAALISSESLLGGRYLALEPGAAEEIIPVGGRIQYTQAPQNIEQLLGQFIFSMNDGKKGANAAEAAPAAAAEPEEKPEFTPHTIPEVVMPEAPEINDAAEDPAHP
ncbi:MAG: outer membrane lipid asymmetry maintenance protein MlaD [Alphaproteobacteria bacterium]